jgi:hypothetical protein
MSCATYTSPPPFNLRLTSAAQFNTSHHCHTATTTTTKMSDIEDRLEDDDCNSFSPDNEETDQDEDNRPTQPTTMQQLVDDGTRWSIKGEPLPLCPYQPSGKKLAKRRFEEEYRFVERGSGLNFVVVYDPDKETNFQAVQVGDERFATKRDKKRRKRLGCVRSLIEIYSDQGPGSNRDTRGAMCRTAMIINERLRELGASRPIDGAPLRRLFSGREYGPLLRQPTDYLIGVLDACFAMYSIGQLSREKSALIKRLVAKGSGKERIVNRLCRRIAKREKKNMKPLCQ